jgi:hypothetical protein
MKRAAHPTGGSRVVAKCSARWAARVGSDRPLRFREIRPRAIGEGLISVKLGRDLDTAKQQMNLPGDALGSRRRRLR